jgi:hypothetical protein
MGKSEAIEVVVWDAAFGCLVVRLRDHHDPPATAKANTGTNLINDLLLSVMTHPTSLAAD